MGYFNIGKEKNILLKWKNILPKWKNILPKRRALSKMIVGDHALRLSVFSFI